VAGEAVVGQQPMIRVNGLASVAPSRALRHCGCVIARRISFGREALD
jgi:hypothetical protein